MTRSILVAKWLDLPVVEEKRARRVTDLEPAAFPRGVETTSKRVVAGRKLRTTWSILAMCAVSLTACDIGGWLEEKADEALQEELKKESERNADDDDGGSKKKRKKKGSTKGASFDPTKAWANPYGDETLPLGRVKLHDAGMTGFSMLAPEGAVVAKSLGGKGADVVLLNKGFGAWVLEDHTATMALMRKAAVAKYGASAEVEDVAPNALLVKTTFSGADVFSYAALFRHNGKTYRCEMQSGASASKRETAMAYAHLFVFLQLDGKPLTPAGSKKRATQDDDTASSAPAPGGAKTKPSKPKKPKARKPCKCAKGDLMCNMRCNSR